MRILLISKTTVIHRPKKLDWWLEAFGAHQLMVLQESYVERYAPDHVLRVPASEAAKVGIESVIQFGKLDSQTEDVAGQRGSQGRHRVGDPIREARLAD